MGSRKEENKKKKDAYIQWLLSSDEEKKILGITTKAAFARKHKLSREILWHWEKDEEFQRKLNETPLEKDQNEAEWEKVKIGFAYFVNTYCMMWKKEGGEPINFLLWPFQILAANKMQVALKLIILKARQMGLSWLSSAYALWKVMTVDNFHVYYTSIGLVEVQEQMERIRFIYMHLPDWLQDKAILGGKGCKDNDRIIEFTNGSAIHASASGKRAGHGAAPGLIICDEWSRVAEAVRKWRALNPSAGPNTQIFLVSTSDGYGNHFADMWFDAVAGKIDYETMFFPWMDNPEYTEAYMEQKRRDFAGDTAGFKEAFPETPEDAFTATSRSVFDFDRIKEWKEYIRENDIVAERGIIELNTEGELDFTLRDEGMLEVWKRPVVGHRYAAGADVSEGLVDGDWSACAWIDCETNEVVALFHGKVQIENYAYHLENTSRWYNNSYLAVEANHNSELILTDLKQSYPYLYLRPQKKHITDLPTLVPGFYMTSTSKPRVVLQLRRSFSDVAENISIYSDLILDEMASFEMTDKGGFSARNGHHDDCVIAVAIANEAKVVLPYSLNEAGQNANRDREFNWLSL